MDDSRSIDYEPNLECACVLPQLLLNGNSSNNQIFIPFADETVRSRNLPLHNAYANHP
jgi:hypothetical protein